MLKKLLYSSVKGNSSDLSAAESFFGQMNKDSVIVTVAV